MIEKQTKKQIAFFQSKLEDINKEYQICLNNFIIQTKQCTLLKNRIEELVESKAAYENVINVLNKETSTMNMFNNAVERPKNNGINSSKFHKDEGDQHEKKNRASIKNGRMGSSNFYNKNKKFQNMTNDKYNDYDEVKKQPLSSQEELKKISKKLAKVNKELENVNKTMLDNVKRIILNIVSNTR